jgi:hypothetical protein
VSATVRTRISEAAPGVSKALATASATLRDHTRKVASSEHVAKAKAMAATVLGEAATQAAKVFAEVEQLVVKLLQSQPRLQGLAAKPLSTYVTMALLRKYCFDASHITAVPYNGLCIVLRCAVAPVVAISMPMLAKRRSTRARTFSDRTPSTPSSAAPKTRSRSARKRISVGTDSVVIP